ncbi:helix-turn-helix domain-containing protein [Pedobacter gandavensis]|uniref:helix-turn-helix domain-containing protein n=1 Tax=Pedobacter gandavensis TaxID=2679963 RepID=UPI002930DA02|nr:helix-turn-helix domain-containing protein [Pedobacter gandavensis]
MKNIARLLNDLNNMTPLSAGFWNDIQPLITERRRKSGYMFLKPGHIASKAWQLVSGFILILRTGTKGEDIVNRIYYPKDIVTDLESFFENVPIRFKFMAIGEVVVLEIKRADVMSLELDYPETAKLIQHVAIAEKKDAEEVLQMLRLPESERVKLFLEKYPVGGLPLGYCASFLNLTLDKYLMLVEALFSSEQIQAKTHPDNPQNDQVNTNHIAYKIIGYLMDNYNQHNIGNARKVADHFNMTTVTLNRQFTKTFGLTIHKFITKHRMEKAEEMLKDGTSTVGKVATEIGYKNIFHFSKVFKNYYGYPPKKEKLRNPS